MNGYEALREHAAWIDLPGRGKIRVSGEDRVRFLHAMTTNHVEQLAPGDGQYAFLLNSQGRILADVYLFHLGESFLLDTEPETAGKVFQHLDKYVIADDVTVADETTEWSTVGLEGSDAAASLEALGAPVPANDCGIALWGARLVARAAATGPRRGRSRWPARWPPASP